MARPILYRIDDEGDVVLSLEHKMNPAPYVPTLESLVVAALDVQLGSLALMFARTAFRALHAWGIHSEWNIQLPRGYVINGKTAASPMDIIKVLHLEEFTREVYRAECILLFRD